MDNRTIQRALQGDEEATRLVESQLRSTARQLLSHPALRVEDPVTQRVLSNAAVAEALERELREADTLLAAAVMAAARRGVEHMRRLQGVDRGAGHLPPGILVSVALVPQILARASREAAEAHLGSCADCTDQARAVRDAAVAADIDDDPEEPTASHIVTSAVESTRQVATLPDVAGPRMGGDASQAAEAMLQRLLDTADAVDAARESGSDASKRRRRRLRRGRKGERPLRALPLAVLGVALLLVLSRLDMRCRPVVDAPRLVPEIAELAVQDIPDAPPRSAWPEASEPGFQELVLGDCAMASDRFRLSRYRQPTQVSLWYWEGITSVCAGRGERAIEALEQARSQEPKLADVDWYLAQAALLAGDIELADAQLRVVCGGTTARVRQACAQLARLEGS
jgi:hypothetical protein